MKRALISDVHANWEALTAVLADIRRQGISEIYCLGDVIGYGPNPRECLDQIIKSCKACLLGNHDQAALFDPEVFNARAERAIFWTREELEDRRGDPVATNLRWDYLGELPRVIREGKFMFVHGSARNPVEEYVFPEDVLDNPRKVQNIFERIDRYCFQGHTHVPGVFTEELKFFSPDEIDGQYALGESKLMINVGSVGQPRDGDPRSSYVTIEDNVVRFHRVAYDMQVTRKKIHATADLDNSLGDRLMQGR